MIMKYLYNGVSLKNQRQSNMDSLLLKSGRINDKDALLVVVCDGVGSLGDGEFASGTAVRLLNDWFGRSTNTDRIGIRMRDAIVEINNYIVVEAQRKSLNTGSTLSALLVIEDHYYIVHVGDSRIYCYEKERLSVLTSDDVSESGKLTACIGKSENIVPQYSEGQATGKFFLLCSDGLYKRMDTNFMVNNMKLTNKLALKESLAALTQYVIDCGEQDNISVALVKIEN